MSRARGRAGRTRQPGRRSGTDRTAASRRCASAATRSPRCRPTSSPGCSRARHDAGGDRRRIRRRARVAAGCQPSARRRSALGSLVDQRWSVYGCCRWPRTTARRRCRRRGTTAWKRCCRSRLRGDLRGIHRRELLCAGPVGVHRHHGAVDGRVLQCGGELVPGLPTTRPRPRSRRWCSAAARRIPITRGTSEQVAALFPNSELVEPPWPDTVDRSGPRQVAGLRALAAPRAAAAGVGRPEPEEHRTTSTHRHRRRPRASRRRRVLHELIRSTSSPACEPRRRSTGRSTARRGP